MKLVPIEVALLRVDGLDVDVANVARVSFDKEVKVFTQAEDKLLGYLARNDHWTPFGHVGAQMRIKAPIFVARQLQKHVVGLVWNEVSRRYVDSEPEFWLPPTWRGRPANAKQGSTGVADHQASWKGLSEQLVRRALDLYQHMIDEGVAPEQARVVLPQCAMTEWIWTGSLAAWARVCKLRMDPHAQAECGEVAQKINGLMKVAFPASWEKLMAPRPAAHALSDAQIEALCKEHGLTGGAVAGFAAALQKQILGAA